VEEPERGWTLTEGAGSRSFFLGSVWLGVISAESSSSGGTWFRVGGEETVVLTKCMDEASLDCGGGSRPRSTGESVSVAETCWPARSGTGELERAGREEGAPVSIRRELMISALVRICLSWPRKMTSLEIKRELIVKDADKVLPNGADPRCPVFHSWSGEALLLLPVKD